jgi:predicted PurR-regulated permease PerM
MERTSCRVARTLTRQGFFPLYALQTCSTLVLYCSWCVGVMYVVYLSQATLILLGISFVVAYLLDPSIDRLERLGLSRTLAISLLTAVALVSIGVLFLVVIPQLQL